MRHLNTFETNRIKELTENSIETTLIEPTKNGLQKSIMDATGSVRLYLKENNIHDFQLQKQGPEHKRLIRAFLIEKNSLIKSEASLYRPNTKKGDPRIWFKNLPSYASPNDILGINAYDNTLYVINITRLDIKALLNSQTSNPLKDFINQIASQINSIAEELLYKLKKIALRGPIPADLQADTAVGRTLERILDLKINSSKKPDYKGIELKSFRDGKDNRKTLFAQVPDWSSSKFKSSAEILKNFGYDRHEDFKLYCTVSSLKRNSQGLKLSIDNKNNWLVEDSDNPKIKDFAIWRFEVLHKRLLEKHNETFWISAKSVQLEGKEYFIYSKVQHTKKPIVPQFDILLEQGDITLDHLIKKASNGKVVEKGPLFKIKPNSLSLLFPPSIEYKLV
jgi:hypothetical protein